MSILVTGGAGYLGSHTAVELLNAGHEVVVVDSLVNAKASSLRRVETITDESLTFYHTDLLDEAALEQIFENEDIESVIHFAGLKAVGESVEMPLTYYNNNLTGTLNLLRAMDTHAVKTIVFSSSATVYGDVQRVPIDEDQPLAPTNPYGWTKMMVEQILRDVAASDPTWRIALLRYFNPVGAHPSGLIGEDPSGTPNNLFPYIAQVATGEREYLSVFGDDYETVDGTGVRDYIHVVDLVLGHLKALEWLARTPGLHTYNLGTGRGYSVLEMVEAFRRASGQPIPYRVEDRRPGDVAISYADASRAANELGWRADRDLDEMCADGWRWQSMNPTGFPND